MSAVTRSACIGHKQAVEWVASRRGRALAHRNQAPAWLLNREEPWHNLSPGQPAGIPGRNEPPMPQFIYTMKDLRKVTPQGKEILKGIWLSFFTGAKIGVLGANGAGKSTLLRIMAGRRPGLRSARPSSAKGYTVGFLPQEPQLDPAKTVLEHVEEAVAAKRASCSRCTRSARASPSRWTTTRWRSCSTSRPGAGPDRRRQPVGARPPRSRSPWTRCAARRATPT